MGSNTSLSSSPSPDYKTKRSLPNSLQPKKKKQIKPKRDKETKSHSKENDKPSLLVSPLSKNISKKKVLAAPQPDQDSSLLS